MSSAFLSRPLIAAGGTATSRGPVWRLAGIVMLVSLAMAWPLFPKVWNSGYFGDTDDALRMVQVRDFLAGQGWFDMTIRRLNPPEGLFNHWSRIVDAPLATLVTFFELFLSPQAAERATRLAFPISMLALLLAGMVRAARSLAGPDGVLPALALVAFAGLGVGQFQPGRIDHHAPQIVLLVFMFALSSEALASGRHRCAALAAFLIILSLGISIENLTFVAALCAFWALLWVVRGDEYAQQISAFGAGLVVALPIVFFATIGPARWTIAVCDAFSVSYATAFFAFGAGCMLAARLRIASIRWRFACMFAVGAATCGVFALLFPHCLRGPLAGVDPLLRHYWLDNVHEARSLVAALSLQKQHTLLTIGPLFVCAVFCIPALIEARGVARLRWTLLGMLVLAGIATTFWQVRAGASLAPLACLAGTWAILKAQGYLQQRKLQTAPILALTVALLVSPFGWAMLHTLASSLMRPAPATAATKAVQPAEGGSCFDTANYTLLSKLPAGIVAAPIDAGAHIIAHTQHSVLAAAYHRNNAGNRKLLNILFAQPDAAAHLIREARVDYIALCKQAAEQTLLQKIAPAGIGAALYAGRVPAWLEELSTSADRMLVYRLRALP